MSGKLNPLVSVIALSYQSAETIIETLNSIYEQTYSRIELIICEDCSNDGTNEICKNWLDMNSARFEKAILIAQEKNKGVVKNYNDGISKSSGEWLKPIACDDVLDAEAIELMVRSSELFKSEWIFCDWIKFTTEIPSEILFQNKAIEINEVYVNENNIKKRIINENIFKAPCLFISKRLIDKVGGLDIRFKHLDDWPLWIKLIENGNFPILINKKLVFYRVRKESISNNGRKKINTLLQDDLWKFYKIYQRKHNGIIENLKKTTTHSLKNIILKCMLK